MTLRRSRAFAGALLLTTALAACTSEPTTDVSSSSAPPAEVAAAPTARDVVGDLGDAASGVAAARALDRGVATGNLSMIERSAEAFADAAAALGAIESELP